MLSHGTSLSRCCPPESTFHFRRIPCSRSPESLFHFTEIPTSGRRRRGGCASASARSWSGPWRWTTATTTRVTGTGRFSARSRISSGTCGRCRIATWPRRGRDGAGVRRGFRRQAGVRVPRADGRAVGRGARSAVGRDRHRGPRVDRPGECRARSEAVGASADDRAYSGASGGAGSVRVDRARCRVARASLPAHRLCSCGRTTRPRA